MKNKKAIKSKKTITKKYKPQPKPTPKPLHARQSVAGSTDKKMRWYILIAFALLLGVIVGFFVTQELSTTGKAGEVTSGYNAIIVTFTGSGSNINTYKVTNIENTTLSYIPAEDYKKYRLTLKSKTGEVFDSRTFDLSDNLNEVKITIVLNPGIEYDASKNHLIRYGADISTPNFTISQNLATVGQ